MFSDLVFSSKFPSYSSNIKNLFAVVTSVLKKNTIIISLNNNCVICREFARYTKSISRGSIPIFPALLTIYLSYSSSLTRFIFYSDSPSINYDISQLFEFIDQVFFYSDISSITYDISQLFEFIDQVYFLFRYSQHYLLYMSTFRIHRPGLFFIPIFPASLSLYVHFSNPLTGFIVFFPIYLKLRYILTFQVHRPGLFLLSKKSLGKVNFLNFFLNSLFFT